MLGTSDPGDDGQAHLDEPLLEQARPSAPPLSLRTFMALTTSVVGCSILTSRFPSQSKRVGPSVTTSACCSHLSTWKGKKKRGQALYFDCLAENEVTHIRWIAHGGPGSLHLGRVVVEAKAVFLGTTLEQDHRDLLLAIVKDPDDARGLRPRAVEPVRELETEGRRREGQQAR